MTAFRNISMALCLGLSMFMFVGANSSSNIKSDCKKINLNNSVLKLLNKTQTHFQPAFRKDKINTIKLLTRNIRKDFLESCKARKELMSFYRKILMNKTVTRMATKHKILDDFMNIDAKLSSCHKDDCKEEDTTGTESMKKLKKIFEGRGKNKKRMVLKAISEFHTLLFWINCVINKEDANKCIY